MSEKIVYNADYFLNQYSPLESEETDEDKKKREEEERKKQEAQIAELIRDEDVELLNYEGKKEKFQTPELIDKIYG
jgi:ribosomal protein S25